MTAARDRYDILGLGCTAVDDLLFVEGYPPADGKTRVLRRERQGGGLTATALVAAARMGARCVYAGTLGEDELSRFVESRLRAEGIDVEFVRRQAGARPVHSVIVVDQRRGTRAIFFDLENAGRAIPEWPAESVIRAARVLFVDPFGIAGMTRAAVVAREAGIPVVADFERVPVEEGFAELAALVGHLIVSEEFARHWTGRKPPGEAARALWFPQREAVVVTCGVEGCWFLGRENPDQPRLFPAFRVPVVDTTGCGDVFHGAYAAGLAQGLDLLGRLRLASAAAALKATQRGGQTGIPTRAAVEEFLKIQ
jgi:ribokinase